VLGNLLDVGDYSVSLFILVLLAEAEDEIQEEQDLNEIV